MKLKGAEPQPRRANLFGGSSLTSPPEFYLLEDKGIVIGNYSGTTCGGCDGLRSEDGRSAGSTEIQRRIRAALEIQPRYILLEGVVISTVLSSWPDFSKSVGGMIYLYLDTPVEVCLERIRQRNRGKRFNEKLVRNKVRQIESTRRKAEALKERVIVLNYQTAWEEFQKFMKELLS